MRPTVSFLTQEMKLNIIDQAFDILCHKGIMYENNNALKILARGNARVDHDSGKVLFSRDLIENTLKTCCKAFNMYDSGGDKTHSFTDYHTHFTPGSSALYYLDGVRENYRKPLTADYINYAKIVAQLPAIAAQSTAFIPSDVPDKISDSYRLFLSLLYCRKPVVTGVFRIESFELMKNLLLAVRGSEKNLKDKPLAVFSCCPTSPLKWSHVTSQNLIDCARLSVPVEIIAMPLAGFIAPVTLMGTIIQHTAETISGIILAQLVNPGTPILYGGSPAIFDARLQTTPMGAMETMMIDCAYNEIGKFFQIPTQAYIALSDAKLLDSQAGIETGMGATLAALAGINSISGPGMMDFENCFSLEKLVVDNEICAMAHRMIAGIADTEQESILPLIEELSSEGHLLTSEHTMQFLRSEHKYPDKIIERANHSQWVSEGKITLLQKAGKRVRKLIDDYHETALPQESQKEVIDLMEAEARLYGMEQLPDFNI